MAKRSSNLSGKTTAQLLKMQADAGKEFTALQERLSNLRSIGQRIQSEIESRSGGSAWWSDGSAQSAGAKRGRPVGSGKAGKAPKGTRGNGVPARIVKFLQEVKKPVSIGDLMTAVNPSSKGTLSVALVNLKKKKLIANPGRGMYAAAKG